MFCRTITAIDEFNDLCDMKWYANHMDFEWINPGVHWPSMNISVAYRSWTNRLIRLKVKFYYVEQLVIEAPDRSLNSNEIISFLEIIKNPEAKDVPRNNKEIQESEDFRPLPYIARQYDDEDPGVYFSFESFNAVFEQSRSE